MCSKSNMGLFVIVVIIMIFMPITVSSKDSTSIENDLIIESDSVVFLLDVSGSMEANDPSRLTFDSIAQLIYSLPTNYSTGIIAYGTDVVYDTGMVSNENRANAIKGVSGISYDGYTNAGAGLFGAMELLKNENSGIKTIIILSDGEIFMDGTERTNESIELFENLIFEAQVLGIKIHVIGLGDEMTDTQNSIFSASTITGGEKFHAPKATDIQRALDSILLEHLNVKKSTVATIEASGENESISVTLPFFNSSKVRILLTSTSPIKNMKADFNAREGVQYNGTTYSLIEMTNPSSNIININFQSAKDSKIKIDIISEYLITAKVDITYNDEILEVKEDIDYDYNSQMSIGFFDVENLGNVVFSESFFNNFPIGLDLNGEKFRSTLTNGQIILNRNIYDDVEIKIGFDFSDFPINVIYGGSIINSLNSAPAVPFKEFDYRVYIVISGIMLSVFTAIVVMFLKLRKKPIKMKPPVPPLPSKYSYTGKLNIYIINSPSGENVPPLTFNLFRMPSSKVISLKEVLESCGIFEIFGGAENIFFRPSVSRSLIVTNNSYCTILKNREILMKNKSYELMIDSKVDITFEDERSEIAFQYKDLKPNEVMI